MKKLIYIMSLLIAILVLYSFVYEKKDELKEHISGYKKTEIINLDEYLYENKTSANLEMLKINKKGDVTYKGKVIVTKNGKTINENSISESYLWLKIYLIANGSEPREGCDTANYEKNGIYGLGCYMYDLK